jgi:MFS transporter, DHA2 family, multidrug resistance protein
MYGRAPIIGERLGQALERGDVAAARAVGLPMDRFFAHLMGAPVDPGVMGYVRAAVEREAMTQSINEAWTVMAALTLIGALLVLASLVRARKAVRRQTWIIHRRQASQAGDS